MRIFLWIDQMLKPILLNRYSYILFIILLMVSCAQPKIESNNLESWASKEAQLKLFKVNPFTRCPFCGEWFPVFEGQDLKSIAMYSQFNADNEYNLVLFGQRGSTVTVFGDFNYGISKGFLIINKIDNKPIYLYDLEQFSENQWAKIDLTEASDAKFNVYYRPYENFKKNLASVKWDRWWK